MLSINSQNISTNWMGCKKTAYLQGKLSNGSSRAQNKHQTKWFVQIFFVVVVWLNRWFLESHTRQFWLECHRGDKKGHCRISFFFNAYLKKKIHVIFFFGYHNITCHLKWRTFRIFPLVEAPYIREENVCCSHYEHKV